MSDHDKIAQFWGEKARKRPENCECHWSDSEIIKRYYIHPAISGNMDENWFSWVKNIYFKKPVEKALSLGCGDGCLERHGAAVDVFKHCDAFDISHGAIEIACEKAKEMGFADRINYELRDLNNIVLKKDHYEAVFCSMSLHHFENLEHVIDQINSSLKEGGLFIVNEYIGPNRFQWTDMQLNMSNDLLRLLPEKYRLDPSTKSVKNSIERTSVEYMIATDPSEAVRSCDILPLIEKNFEIIRKIDYGGTLINILLDNIIVNFDEKKTEDLAILKLIFFIEKLLIQRKILNSDFTVIIARKKRDQAPQQGQSRRSMLKRAVARLQGIGVRCSG